MNEECKEEVIAEETVQQTRELLEGINIIEELHNVNVHSLELLNIMKTLSERTGELMDIMSARTLPSMYIGKVISLDDGLRVVGVGLVDEKYVECLIIPSNIETVDELTAIAVLKNQFDAHLKAKPVVNMLRRELSSE